MTLTQDFNGLNQFPNSERDGSNGDGSKKDACLRSWVGLGWHKIRSILRQNLTNHRIGENDKSQPGKPRTIVSGSKTVISLDRAKSGVLNVRLCLTPFTPIVATSRVSWTDFPTTEWLTTSLRSSRMTDGESHKTSKALISFDNFLSIPEGVPKSRQPYQP
jgi:hypothetical protein